jgi:hypothetical protein
MKTKKKKVAAKKKPAKAAKKSGSQLKIVNMKVGSKDRAALNAMAKKHAKGNLSAWLRHAGLKYVPKKGEKIAADSYSK